MTDRPDTPDALDPVYPNPRDPAEALDRRHFLAVTGAAAALAGAGCSPRPAPHGQFVPYVRPPEGVTPGQPLTFTTAMALGGSAIGLVVTSREGRPIKVDGNPDHPASRGASDLFAQASILDLYDPDRSRVVTRRGAPRAWDECLAALRVGLEKQRPKQGAGLRLLTGALASPTLAAVLGDFFHQFPKAKWARHEPCDGNAQAGSVQAFGEPAHAICDFSKADVVLSLGADFLACSPGTAAYHRQFADRRRVRRAGGVPADRMSRLYAVETMLTTTGASADHRLALRPSEVESFARAVAAELGVAGVPAGGAIAETARAWVAPLARDLAAHRGRSLVVVGEGQPASLHALGHAINAHLGNLGATVRYTEPIEPRPGRDPTDLRTLVEEMAAGTVEMLIVLGSNPAYDAPADVPFAEALKHVPLSAHLGLYPDETAAVCEWHVPEAHYLETWGDAVALDGTVSIQQPLIEPLYGGRSAIEFLTAVPGPGEPTGRDLVRAHWQSTRKNPADFDITWEDWLRRGVVPDTTAKPKGVTLKADWAGSGTAGPAGAEIQFLPDPTLFDGRFANNAWLQELPKPTTKLTWGNAAFLSPVDARTFGIEATTVDQGGQHGGITTDVVELRLGGRSIRLPAFPLAGHADGAVTVYLGHGRDRAGHVGTGVGANAYRLRTADAPWSSAGLEIVKTGERETVACTQWHHRMEGRDPVRHTTAGAFPGYAAPSKIDEGVEKAAVTALPQPGESTPPPAIERDGRLTPLSLYPEWSSDRRWAMAIDLATCTGCSACVVACQAENNIPTVGKAQVLRAREMHWIRIDRYDVGPDPDRPENVFFQPVPCMQCEKAPCELVCPVGATVHSHDGLNDMVYNRCVGTRYCSNNCPYKVRRFNFLTYADFNSEADRARQNPEVTVRSRGVMEKCTYCVQRIRAAEIESEQTGKPIPDGRVRTACQQACPSGAIAFGDWNDPASAVRRWKGEPHDYGLLAELNTRPRTSYLAAVRNPNPAMPGGA